MLFFRQPRLLQEASPCPAGMQDGQCLFAAVLGTFLVVVCVLSLSPAVGPEKGSPRVQEGPGFLVPLWPVTHLGPPGRVGAVLPGKVD